MEKIGDLILTLNSDQWQPFNGESCHWWISKGLEPLVEAAEPARFFTSFARNFSWNEFKRACAWLRNHRPERAFVFHAPWWVGLALLLAGVKHRVGRRSQWHSYLFFNFGIRQKRSQALMHENEYNIELIRTYFDRLKIATPAKGPSPLRMKAPSPSHSFLQSLGLSTQRYCVVHPGMAGSALNWPVKNYALLIEKLSYKVTVAITGGPFDHKIISELKAELPSKTTICFLDGKLQLNELLSVLQNSLFLVAPSTGVLHIGASLGVPVYGIYSPRRVEHPRRWGPQGPKTQVYVPEVDADLESNPSVMFEIKPESIYRDLISHLSEGAFQ
ncbi:MAG: glycosyltransferase family 9 protein [Bdellovibrionales bacterium]|nr:glycosyltransferase family 9 protein [Bdellovibrionales bacterium]